MSLSDWLQERANATRLEACELALGTFCAEADTNSGYMLQVADAVWTLLLGTMTPVGGEPAELVAEIRAKMTGLSPDRLEQVSKQLLETTSAGSEVHAVAGKLVAYWFRVIALQQHETRQASRARHLVRSYEESFVSMARLLDRQVQHSRKQP